MKTLAIAVAALLVAALAMPTGVLAGQDQLQRQLHQRLAESKRKQEEAEQAKAAEREKLIKEHMAMMQENMKMMQAMKPRPGMTMQEHEEWIAEHQKLMDDMLEQMVKDHQMLIQLSK